MRQEEIKIGARVRIIGGSWPNCTGVICGIDGTMFEVRVDAAHGRSQFDWWYGEHDLPDLLFFDASPEEIAQRQREDDARRAKEEDQRAREAHALKYL
jgi:hypothetical protein